MQTSQHLYSIYYSKLSAQYTISLQGNSKPAAPASRAPGRDAAAIRRCAIWPSPQIRAFSYRTCFSFWDIVDLGLCVITVPFRAFEPCTRRLALRRMPTCQYNMRRHRDRCSPAISLPCCGFFLSSSQISISISISIYIYMFDSYVFAFSVSVFFNVSDIHGHACDMGRERDRERERESVGAY